jgi:excisionase family DNA binding protein
MGLNNQFQKYYTPHEMAELIGITVGTLATWRMTGRYNLPYIKVGRRVRYEVQAVQSWLDSRTHSHTGEVVA